MDDFRDRLALRELHNIYVHAIDRGDLALLRSLYCDDAVERHGDFTGNPDEFVAWLTPVVELFQSVTHFIGNHLFVIDGDTAQSESRGTAFVRLKGTPAASYIVVNRHFDRYRKQNGIWFFSERVTCVDWAEALPERSAPLALVAPFPTGASDGTDPVYALPGLVDAIRKSRMVGPDA